MSIYPNQLLNDLHDHFPDILYNPSRFTNVQDLLQYIREVANVNPYNVGRRMYRNRPFRPLRTIEIPVNNDINSLIHNVFNEFMGVPLDASRNRVDAAENDFMNRVPVRPTTEQIAESTIVYNSLMTQDDICIICQDAIESDQQVRRIRHCNHYFHKTCIDTWFQEYVQCPTCRHDIRES